MAITKKLRFEVFKRDGFKCAYCGKCPPAVVLEVDHIDPKSKGGKDDINNLLTACFDCNRGKKDIPLTKIPNKLSENIEILEEKETQLKEYLKFIKKIEKRVNDDIKEISAVYQDAYPGWEFNDKFKLSIKRFLDYLPRHEIKNSLEKAIVRFPKNNPSDRGNATKYFCGICWSIIKNKGRK